MPTELTTPRLHLDAWRDDDIDDYDTLVNERDLRTAAAPHGGRPTRDELRERILRQQASHADTGIGLLVIRTADRFAGYCGLTVGRASLAEPELAYELLTTYQGNGYATEAANATVHAAAGTGRRRLWATVRTWNDASFHVLEKVGFERTRPHHDGRLRRQRLVHARALTAAPQYNTGTRTWPGHRRAPKSAILQALAADAFTRPVASRSQRRVATTAGICTVTVGPLQVDIARCRTRVVSQHMLYESVPPDGPVSRSTSPAGSLHLLLPSWLLSILRPAGPEGPAGMA